MTIKALELVFFEGHESTVLGFGPGVTAITGRSGHGKSSIVRGFNWTLTNQPMGESMISHFAGDNETVSSIEFEEDTYIVRTRGNKENSYMDSSSDDLYKALRGKVPDSVPLISNMNETNIQKQRDFYFMLDDTPGQVARMFNKVSGLAEKDHAETEINKRCKAKKKEMDILSARDEYIDKTLAETVWIVEADKNYQAIEVLEEKEKEITEEIIFLGILVDEIEAIEEEIKSYHDPEAIERIDTIFEVENELIEIEEEIDELQNLLDSSLQLEKEIKDIRLPDKGRIKEIEDVAGELNDIYDDIAGLSLLINQIEEISSDLEDITDELNAHQMDYDTLLHDCKICPTCGAQT